MDITTKLQYATATSAPMQNAGLHVNAVVTPITATPVLAGAFGLLGAFGVGFAVGQATCRG